MTKIFNTKKVDGVFSAPLGEITHTVVDGADTLKVLIQGKTYEIVNLENQTKTNGKVFMRGSMVVGKSSYATVNIERTSTDKIMCTLFIKDPNLAKNLGGVDRLQCLIENGTGALTVWKDSATGSVVGEMPAGEQPADNGSAPF